MAEVTLIIVAGPNEGRSFDLAGVAVLGRDTSAGIVLEDSEASRRHASISVEGTTAAVEDLGSTNGTFVNGERIEGSRQLNSGDKIRIGTTVLEFKAPEPEDAGQATRIASAIPDPEVTRAREVPDFASGPPADAPTEAPGAPPTPAPPTPEPVASSEPPAAPPIPEAPSEPPTAAPIPEPPPTSIDQPIPPPPPGPPPAPEGFPPSAPAGGPAPAPVGGPPPPPPGGGFDQPQAPPPPPPGGGFEQPQAPPAPPAAGFPPTPGGPPVAYGDQGGFSPGGYPVDLQVDYPENGIARWRAFFQGFMLIPQIFVLYFVIFAAYFVIFASFFGTLFTGRWTPGFQFAAGVLRWAQRVGGYAYLLTEAYPPFDTQPHPEYPIRVRIDEPPKIARWRPLVHWLMVIPHLFVIQFLAIGALFAFIWAWFSILFTRRYPPGAFNFIVGVSRWNLRATAYLLWMREEYPPFSLE